MERVTRKSDAALSLAGIDATHSNQEREQRMCRDFETSSFAAWQSGPRAQPPEMRAGGPAHRVAFTGPFAKVHPWRHLPDRTARGMASQAIPLRCSQAGAQSIGLPVTHVRTAPPTQIRAPSCLM
jgi:hypothetical protein